MTVMTSQHPQVPESRDDLLDAFLSLETPPGFRAELIDGEIVVSPPPVLQHDRIVMLINQQITRHSRVPMDCGCVIGLVVPDGPGIRGNHVIPDLVVVPSEADAFNIPSSWAALQEVALAVEVTSQRAERDRDAKRLAYARADIDLYLLVDRERLNSTLFGDPQGDDYREHVTVPFGKSLPLPEPFGFDLDTSQFN